MKVEGGRFYSVDPLADQFAAWTPYHYVHNNPVILTDPTGMKADTSIVTTQNGQELFRWDDGSTENTFYSRMDEVTVKPTAQTIDTDNSSVNSNLLTGGDIMAGSLLYSLNRNIEKKTPMLMRDQAVTKGHINSLKYNLFGNVSLRRQSVINLRNITKVGGPLVGFGGVAYNSQYQSNLATGFDAGAYGLSFMKGGFGYTMLYTMGKTAVTNFWNMTPEEQYQTANPYWYGTSNLSKK